MPQVGESFLNMKPERSWLFNQSAFLIEYSRISSVWSVPVAGVTSRTSSSSLDRRRVTRGTPIPTPTSGQTGTKVTIFAERINDGMRSGIPSEDWAVVVTVYEDGKKIARFLGNESGRTARVVLLDSDGKVLFFHDRGFSLRSLLDLKKTTKQFSHQITAGLEVRD